jgi:hypothetical protein
MLSILLTSGSEISTLASPGRLRVGVAGDLQENRGLKGLFHEIDFKSVNQNLKNLA